MKLICPKCGSKIGLDQAETSADFTALINLAAGFGKGWIWADEYMASFAPQAGWLKLKTKIRHLETLAVIWDAEQFNFQTRQYRTDKKRIIEAMVKVSNAHKQGLNSHNYLKKVLMDTAELEDAQGRTAQEETAREHSKRSGRPPTAADEENTGEPGLKKFLEEKGVNSLADLIPKGMDDEI